ncbi:hypothetical protein BGZ60DRAFT_386454 [Tricladium varicosporioides]|nr:hypothetical protein BGZ60DRAFT_386454 [Hymenoscyphus varicosporioides]
MIRDINTTPSTSTTITLTSTPSPTTSTAPAISTKALATCHQQGMPTTILLTFMISSHPSPSVLECQGSCKAEEKCLSYSHREVSAANSAYPNCELFSRKWDSKENGTDLVIKSWRYGIYYSDRFPGDGSEECFVAVDGN